MSSGPFTAVVGHYSLLKSEVLLFEMYFVRVRIDKVRSLSTCVISV